MAKSTQTFRKRQREHKLREKAQIKRERRAERSKMKKALIDPAGSGGDLPAFNEFESKTEAELDVEENA
jgi:hypothetical protein